MSPIDTLFSDIDDLCDIAVKAEVTLTQVQGINIAYVLLVKTRQFSSAICVWNCLPLVKKIWHNFTDHLREAKNELKDLEELQGQSEYNANLMTTLIEGMQTLLERDKDASTLTPSLNKHK
mmetsp:Transcript_2347/g.3283  ORF Transcript_2347/g.3283 Transcript_2347/m.3283 type:complete len:121 (+) Transcript_2347:372-734(+)